MSTTSKMCLFGLLLGLALILALFFLRLEERELQDLAEGRHGAKLCVERLLPARDGLRQGGAITPAAIHLVPNAASPSSSGERNFEFVLEPVLGDRVAERPSVLLALELSKPLPVA